MILNPITIDLSTWDRLPDVDAYAKRWGLGLTDAIQELVNAGLNPQPANKL